jgi:hypothetical protein
MTLKSNFASKHPFFTNFAKVSIVAAITAIVIGAILTILLFTGILPAVPLLIPAIETVAAYLGISSLANATFTAAATIGTVFGLAVLAIGELISLLFAVTIKEAPRKPTEEAPPELIDIKTILTSGKLPEHELNIETLASITGNLLDETEQGNYSNKFRLKQLGKALLDKFETIKPTTRGKKRIITDQIKKLDNTFHFTDTEEIRIKDETLNAFQKPLTLDDIVTLSFNENSEILEHPKQTANQIVLDLNRPEHCCLEINCSSTNYQSNIKEFWQDFAKDYSEKHFPKTLRENSEIKGQADAEQELAKLSDFAFYAQGTLRSSIGAISHLLINKQIEGYPILTLDFKNSPSGLSGLPTTKDTSVVFSTTKKEDEVIIETRTQLELRTIYENNEMIDPIKFYVNEQIVYQKGHRFGIIKYLDVEGSPEVRSFMKWMATYLPIENKPYYEQTSLGIEVRIKLMTLQTDLLLEKMPYFHKLGLRKIHPHLQQQKELLISKFSTMYPCTENPRQRAEIETQILRLGGSVPRYIPPSTQPQMTKEETQQQQKPSYIFPPITEPLTGLQSTPSSLPAIVVAAAQPPITTEQINAKFFGNNKICTHVQISKLSNEPYAKLIFTENNGEKFIQQLKANYNEQYDEQFVKSNIETITRDNKATIINSSVTITGPMIGKMNTILAIEEPLQLKP